MSVTDTMHPLRRHGVRAGLIASALLLAGAGVAFAKGFAWPDGDKVAALLKARLPKTEVSKVDCSRIGGLCEVVAGSNLFYVDSSARYLVIGRVYDMESRQDLTAARLLELNPAMLLGGAASSRSTDGEDLAAPAVASPAAAARGERMRARPDRILSLAGLPKSGAIVWGAASGPTVTVFSDFTCSYCRALSGVLAELNVRVVERPISILGSRALSELVYCAKDPARALRRAYAGDTLEPASCDTSGLDANERFATANGIAGTPVIVRSDGAMIEGFRPKETLAAWLKGAR
ncbi:MULTISPECIES: DsbC family protein [Sphingomonadaceae]|uniref:Thiol:disulfide interchange protein n=1 Tax=Rhizorhabdus wittichii TaxID=160791 RepID=A0A975D8Q8_9SPHN|nr:MULTISPECIES: DsbC family protein [Sphingomonadaceae]QTH24773.1 DsbC family protein [Rhizorhabdus wittichii]QUM74481.1 DsbC family protein [Sphingopyxis granuli]